MSTSHERSAVQGSRGPPVAATPRLPEGHRAPLAAADQLMGGFCLYMTVVAVIAWARGESSWPTPFVIFCYVAVNFLTSRLITSRAKRPDHAELFRLAVMTIANPIVYLMTDGPLALWWPGFLINALGQGIVLGLITQRAFWGSVLAAYYVALYALATVLGVRAPNWYEFALHVGVIAMVTLLWAKIMSLLGAALRNEHDRTIELAKARDALFSEMEIAQKIQTLLLPRDPKLAGHALFGSMMPATEVGGDYYDVIDVGGRRAFLAIGDVSGHGVTSGLTMMMARAGLLGALGARPDAPLAEIYCSLNRSLYENLRRMGVEMYMTFALLEHVHAGTFRAVGRHLPMLIFRRASREVEEVELEGSWLGMLDDLDPTSVPETTMQLAPGDVIVLYTDGIVEHSRGDEMFGYERLKALVAEHAGRGPERLVDAIRTSVREFAPGRDDDMTLLVVDHLGEVRADPTP